MKTVVILGASASRHKYGNKALRAFRQMGHAVYAVNPNHEKIEGLPAYQRLADVPVRPDTISAYLPPPIMLELLPEVAAKGCDELWLNPGADSPAVVAEAQRLGLNVIQACSILGVGLSPEDL